jgi:hypothetical protein
LISRLQHVLAILIAVVAHPQTQLGCLRMHLRPHLWPTT